VGCRQQFAQSQLARFVRTPDGWRPDSRGGRKQAGRGAYLCSPQCVQRAVKNKRYPGLGTAAVEYGLIRSSMREKER
jgi:predicted RNA-binding protein YlxR (DUF448 family)